MRFSLIIPCYNEALNLPGLLERCAKLTTDPRVEIVLVDNGSTDDTPQVLPKLLAGMTGIRSIRVGVNRGYGFGILSGLRAGEGDILGWTHADQQTDPMDAATGLAFFDKAADPTRLFVKGRRYGRPLVDSAFTAGMSVFETLLTQRVMRDINAQPTMFHRSFFESWDNPPHDFALDLYAYWLAKDAGLAMQRFPVRFGPRKFGASHWNTGMKARMKFVRRTLAFSFDLKRKRRAGR
ncbi:glycosyltransferase family 2 protein [Sphingomonas sp. HITSZ_GF]|uniref:glycosyltransferase family 2 protein n=1 Tax=Sphingomonas sp. HITSZ_GF TaxID=3037247 RepID=UPI00240DF4FD|nr:glycosyltransferase family 2 protein [Sphingomonas sp. HITSZ_GF]MDG2535766.1 glycosyltransferase family 2 protein [Sphingomonas sp. HITSZ_GF]